MTDSKGAYIKDIRPGMAVQGIFLVKDKVQALTKNGLPYLTLNLSDKTGDLEGRIWEKTNEWNGLFKKGDYVLIEAQAESFRDQTQLNIMRLEACVPTLVNPADFLPSSVKDIEEMWRELKGISARIKNDHLAELLRNFFRDKAFGARFKTAPAAKRMHHAYLGGLLEHTLSLTRLVSAIIPEYPQLDGDLLLAGTILHDVGKTREFTYPPESSFFDYTDEGRLVGHIVIGAQMVQEKIDLMRRFPRDLAMVLKHLVLSHHGEYEFGSPKRPKTAEAFVLHLSDDLDAKINALSGLKSQSGPSAQWSNFFRPLERYIFLGGVGKADQERVLPEEKDTTDENYSLLDRLKDLKK
ncbi:MAG: HD domain-containing protein [Pseudomonadota bacterium]